MSCSDDALNRVTTPVDAAIVTPNAVRHGFHQQPHPTTKDRLDQPAYHGHCFACGNTAAVVTHHHPEAAAPRSLRRPMHLRAALKQIDHRPP